MMMTNVPQAMQAPMPTPVVPVQPEMWPKKFPSLISVLFAVLQAIVTIAIIGCEIGSILIDAVTATIYVGLWGGLFFLFAWIAQAATSCCCRNFGCATYTMILQVISLVFSACVIGFDSYFITYPTTCFYPSSTCTGGSRGILYSSWNFDNIKMPLIEGQLAAGAVMFLLSLVTILIYIITVIRVRQAKKQPTILPQPTYQPTQYHALSALPAATYPALATMDYNTGRVTEIDCPTCNSKMGMTVRRPMHV